jgi:hypothetical protein
LRDTGFLNAIEEHLPRETMSNRRHHGADHVVDVLCPVLLEEDGPVGPEPRCREGIGRIGGEQLPSRDICAGRGDTADPSQARRRSPAPLHFHSKNSQEQNKQD